MHLDDYVRWRAIQKTEDSATRYEWQCRTCGRRVFLRAPAPCAFCGREMHQTGRWMCPSLVESEEGR